MENNDLCPSCQSPYGYEMNDKLVCPECAFEWEIKIQQNKEELIVKDSNGNILQNGDSVSVVKDLPVKGSSSSIKVGTKVKNIKLVEGDHNIACKIEGFGSIGLKSEFVKKI